MNIEKLVNSKFYRGFEWFYRLVILNLLIVLISFSLAAIPFLYWYYNYYGTSEKGFIVLIAIIFFAIALFPTFITSFLVIKHYMEDKIGNIFVLFFRYLIDTIKRTYIIGLSYIAVLIVLTVGLYINWVLLSPENYRNNIFGYISIVSFATQFFLLVLLVLMYINLTYIISHFRMKVFDYIRLALRFSFRYMLQSIVSLLILIVPVILLMWMGMKFLPIYFILGLSLPQYFLYLLMRNRFGYLSRNLNNNEIEV